MVCSDTNAPEYSKALELFGTISGRVCGERAAECLWEKLPELDRQRLGGVLEAAYFKYCGAVGMWKQLRGVSQRRAIMDVAELIGCLELKRYRWLLRMAGEVSDDPEKAIRRHIAAGHLVLTDTSDGPRRAYWKGELINIDWLKNDKPWLYLWNLARSAKAGGFIDRLSFGGNFGCDYLTKMKHRLVNLPGFPFDLGDLIVPAGRGTHCLKLERERIHVIETHAVEIAREYLG